MADFDLIQTDAQVQSILNDGQNMQGAGAQTTLTTESVLLKDVNGNYHKILKSSFTEAIRDTLAGLLVNNDKGTTINQIAAIANGDFGSITPDNLASVLGGLQRLNSLSSNFTANDVEETSVCYSASSSYTSLHLPDAYGVLITIKVSESHAYGILQIFVRANFDAIYFRLKDTANNTWSSWAKWNGLVTA